jgi:hypothetical protein
MLLRLMCRHSLFIQLLHHQTMLFDLPHRRDRFMQLPLPRRLLCHRRRLACQQLPARRRKSSRALRDVVRRMTKLWSRRTSGRRLQRLSAM